MIFLNMENGKVYVVGAWDELLWACIRHVCLPRQKLSFLIIRSAFFSQLSLFTLRRKEWKLRNKDTSILSVFLLVFFFLNDSIPPFLFFFSSHDVLARPRSLSGLCLIFFVSFTMIFPFRMSKFALFSFVLFLFFVHFYQTKEAEEEELEEEGWSASVNSKTRNR